MYFQSSERQWVVFENKVFFYCCINSLPIFIIMLFNQATHLLTEKLFLLREKAEQHLPSRKCLSFNFHLHGQSFLNYQKSVLSRLCIKLLCLIVFNKQGKNKNIIYQLLLMPCKSSSQWYWFTKKIWQQCKQELDADCYVAKLQTNEEENTF